MHNKFTFSLLFVFLFNIYTIQAQQQNLNPNLITYPVSPEAARLGSFGNVPINLFYGQLDKSIGLFDGKIGDYSLPVNLSYSYAGNRVDETPSIVGLGWQLNVGGSVTREVRGYQDEHPIYGYYRQDSQYRASLIYNYNSMTLEQANEIMSGRLDLEADKYNLSVNGINFSFKIGLDGKPAFLSKHNYKLEVIREPLENYNIASFILTDTNSNRYYFEYKEINEPVTSGENYMDQQFPVYVSSWQLSKIVLNNDSIITYNYQDDAYTSFSHYASDTRSKNPIPLIPPIKFIIGGWIDGGSTEYIQRKILTSITSDSFSINFNISTRNSEKVYDKITIKDFKNNIVNFYDLKYSGSRNYLEKINRNNQFFYEFTYIGSPQNFIKTTAYPYNQDHWGFDNGATNNSALPRSGLIVNNEPSFLHTVTGALETIKYPTGGLTKIFYEQNTIPAYYTQVDDTELNTRIHLKFKSDNLPSAPETKSLTYTKTFDTDVLATLSHTFEAPNSDYEAFTMIISGAISEGYCSGNYFLTVPQKRASDNATNTGTQTIIPKVCPTLYTTIDDECSDPSCKTVYKDSGGKFIIPAGTYQFTIVAWQNQTKDIKAEIVLDFLDPLVSGSYVNKKTGGIRVSKTIDYANDNDNHPITKYYDYNENNLSTGEPYQSNLTNTFEYDYFNNIEPQYEWQGYIQVTVDWPGIIATVERNAKSYNQISKRGVPVFYKKVKEYSVKNEIFTPAPFLCGNCGDNIQYNYDNTLVYSYIPMSDSNESYGTIKTSYPEGCTVTNFSASYSNNEYPFTPAGNDLSLGRVESKEIYAKTDTTGTDNLLLKEKNEYIETNYTNSPSIYRNDNYPRSLKLGYNIRLRNPLYGTDSDVIRNYKLGLYEDFDVEFFKNNINTKEYFNGQALEKSVDITYDNYFQQKTITTKDSNNNILANELFYSYNFNDSVSQAMVNKNCISPLVQVINKKNSTILETTKFDFGEISTNLFKPFSFAKSKANDLLEKKITYDQYDANGTIQQYTPENGTPASVIWGYNKTQPIAKIENATYASITPGLIVDAQTASDTGTEAGLLTALDSLRASLPNAMVTTYTYIPLVGVSTITDPKGDKITYTYDSFGRLQNVKDKNGNILSENEYHYKN